MTMPNTSTCAYILSFGMAAVIAYLLRPTLRENCRPRQQVNWWQTEIIYQIYIRSFQDSDGDGVGDLKGIISRLSYLSDLQVGIIRLSPFYMSPMRDFGYDVSNYTEVDPIFGNMSHLDILVMEAHRRGMRVIIDFVPNHTSNDSMWFVHSRKSHENKYSDYYVWHPGKLSPNGTRVPPNNWLSGFGGPAWHWDDSRGQFYYHHYLTSQPDLNYRNIHVQREMDDVLHFWLAKGIDGFRLDAVSWLFETSDITEDEHGYSEYTANQPETFMTIRRWKSILEAYVRVDGRQRVLLAQGPDQMHYKTRKQYTEAGSQAFFFDLVQISQICGTTVTCFFKIIKNGLNVTDGQRPNFQLGNHNSPRVADRLGTDYVDAMNVLLLTLPGTASTYYGEELGMRGGNYTGLPPRDAKAIQSQDASISRDPGRNPMQWEPGPYAGFTDCRSVRPDTTCPWLPITDNTDPLHINVQSENSSLTSSLAIYKNLAKLRRTPAFQNTDIEFPVGDEGDILAYIRWDESQTYVILINLGPEGSTTNLSGHFDSGSVVMTTHTRLSAVIDMSNIVLMKGEAMILLIQ